MLCEPVFSVLFVWTSCCTCYANAKKASRHHQRSYIRCCSLLMTSPVCALSAWNVCVLVLFHVHGSDHVYVWAREDCIKEGERFFSFFLITKWQAIPWHSVLTELARFLIISVQILVRSFTQIACSCLPLFAFTIWWHTQLSISVSLRCLSTLITAWLKGPIALKCPILTFHCKHKPTTACIVYCKHSVFPLVLFSLHWKASYNVTCNECFIFVSWASKLNANVHLIKVRSL